MSCLGGTVGDCYAAAWAQRVVDNGGARPAQANVDAAATFYNSLVTANILSKMKVINFVAPDSLIAMRTPFIRKYGLDPWTDVSATPYAAANLTVDGLINTGGWNNALNTGVIPSTAFASYTNAGATVYLMTNTGAGGAYGHIGVNNGTWQFAMYANAGTQIADMGPGGPGFVTAAQTIPGYYSGNRSAANAAYLYFATPTAAHSAIGSNLANVPGGEPNIALYAMAFNMSGVKQFNDFARVSFISLHESLSAPESLAFYNAVQALRIGFGGGFIVDLNNALSVATDWGRRVVANGGAMPSDASKNAARTFWQAIIDAGMQAKVKALNFYAPDNLIASITPLVAGVGLSPWTNNNFLAGDLTVNGLKGNGTTKHLHTGVQPSTEFDLQSHSLVSYFSENDNSDGCDLGAGTNPYNNGYALWGDVAGASVVDLPYPAGRYSVANASWLGYLCASRINGSDCRLYKASSGFAHAEIGNDLAARADDRASVTATIWAFCLNRGGANVSHSTRRHSFDAIMTGLSAGESLALFNAVQALRTSLGGGFV